VKKISTWLIYAPTAASSRVRVLQYESILASRGYQLRRYFLYNSIITERILLGTKPSLFEYFVSFTIRAIELIAFRRSEVEIVYRELLPFIPFAIERIFLKRKYILDLDDAFYLKYKDLPWPLSVALKDKHSMLIKNAACVTVGNEYLYDYATDFSSSVSIIYSSASSPCIESEVDEKEDDLKRPFVIGWIGSPSTQSYLEIVHHVIMELLDEYNMYFVVVGATMSKLPYEMTVNPRVSLLRWNKEEEAHVLRNISVGIMPLPDEEWARGKSGYKLIQYLSHGKPVVASPVGINAKIVSADVGVLAKTKEEWKDALIRISSDHELYKRFAAAARKRFESTYSNTIAAEKLVHIITSL